MPAPSYRDSKQDLIEAMRVTPGSGSRQFDIAKAILDVKLQEEAAQHAKGLVFATWGLVIATIGLTVTGIIQIIK